MGYKMKGFSGFKESPVKQKFLNRAPEDFDWKAAKKRGLEMAKRDMAKSGHGTIEDLKAKRLKDLKNSKSKMPKNFNTTGSNWPDKTPGYSTTKAAKAKTKTLKQVVKKGARNILKGASRLAGGVGLAAMAYDAYKSGQKHSGGKAVKGQKTGVVTPDKSKSIWKK